MDNRPQLGSPVWRIAAATGEEPADVEAAISTLCADGWDWDRIWKLLEAGIGANEKVVDIVARALTAEDVRQPPRRGGATRSEKFERHRRKRNNRRANKRRN